MRPQNERTYWKSHFSFEGVLVGHKKVVKGKLLWKPFPFFEIKVKKTPKKSAIGVWSIFAIFCHPLFELFQLYKNIRLVSAVYTPI